MYGFALFLFWCCFYFVSSYITNTAVRGIGSETPVNQNRFPCLNSRSISSSDYSSRSSKKKIPKKEKKINDNKEYGISQSLLNDVLQNAARLLFVQNQELNSPVVDQEGFSDDHSNNRFKKKVALTNVLKSPSLCTKDKGSFSLNNLSNRYKKGMIDILKASIRDHTIPHSNKKSKLIKENIRNDAILKTRYLSVSDEEDSEYDTEISDILNDGSQPYDTSSTEKNYTTTSDEDTTTDEEHTSSDEQDSTSDGEDTSTSSTETESTSDEKDYLLSADEKEDLSSADERVPVKKRKEKMSNSESSRNTRRKQYFDDIESSVENGVRNFQADVPIDLGLLERHFQTLKEIIGLQNGSIEVELINEKLMRDLNRSYLGKNDSTDILSFSYDGSVTGFGKAVKKKINPADLEYGFISICPAFVQRQCDEDRRTFEEHSLNPNQKHFDELRGVNRHMATIFNVQGRLPFLLIHGLLHLMRYDHEEDIDYEKMVQYEEAVANEFILRRHEYKPCYSGHYVIGVGTDICHIPRIREILEKNEKKFIERIFGVYEAQVYYNLKSKFVSQSSKATDWLVLASSYVAKRFATKEAVAKALGTGLRHVSPDGIRLKDIEVFSLPGGQPAVELIGAARDIQHSLGVCKLAVSQTDERDFALSFVTAYGSTSDSVMGDPDWESRHDVPQNI